MTSNTHYYHPCWKSFHLEIWDISLLFTHFSLNFSQLLRFRISYFLPFGGLASLKRVLLKVQALSPSVHNLSIKCGSTLPIISKDFKHQLPSFVPWFIRTKHFPESKTHPRIQKHYRQNTKTLPRIQNTSQNPKTLPRIQKHIQNPKQVPESKTHPRIWILESVVEFWNVFFGFWEVFCPLEPP